MSTDALPVSDVRKRLADRLNRAAYAGERTIITKSGAPVAALVPIEDLEVLELLEDRLDVEAALDALRDAGEHGGTLTLDAFRQELGR